jgi:biopolymer transport protein TolR
MMANRRGRRLMGEINVVPYIDVMLVLLIIFMVTAPLLTQGIKVDLPKAGAEPLPEELMREHQPLILSVDSSGSYYLNIGENEESPLDEATVVERVSTVLRREPKTPVLVKADKAVPYGQVVAGMVLLQQSGAEKVGFITDPAEGGGKTARKKPRS